MSNISADIACFFGFNLALISSMPTRTSPGAPGPIGIIILLRSGLITPNATIDEIKSSFRKLSLKYHPDKNQQFVEQYTNIIKAYKYLINNNKLIPYDNSNTICEKNDISKINDIYTSLSIELTDIYNDTSIPVEIKRTITKNNYTIEEIETIYINIFSGIDTNEIIIIKDKGHIDNSVQGDIKVKIIVKNNTIFKRQGLHLILNKEITLKEALCGFEFQFTHLNNEIYYIKNYNNIIYPTYQKILPQLGLKRNKIYGQLIIKFIIIFPKYISDDKKKLLHNIF